MTFRALLAVAALAAPAVALAHVSIVDGQARPGTVQAVTFRVSHGCKAEPTTGLRIELPAGVAAEPVAKPGWRVAQTPGAVSWSGRSADRQPDSFALKLRLPRGQGPLYFPAVQTCADQTVRWDERPRGSDEALAHPAPVLLLTDNPQAAPMSPHAGMDHGGHAMAASPPEPPRAAQSEAGPPRLSIVSAWSRPTPNGAPTAVGYLTILNTGVGSDRLLGGQTPVARTVEVHSMSMDGGIMRMRPLPQGLAVRAMGRTVVGPGGDHLMLIGLKRPLKLGDKVPVTLRFAKSGELKVMLAVGTEPR